MIEPARRAALLARFEEETEWPLTALAIALVPVIILPDLIDFSEHATRALDFASATIWAIFTAALAIRVALAEGRPSFLLRNWFDVLLVLVPVVGFLPTHAVGHYRAAIGLVRAMAAIARTTRFGRRIVEHHATNALATLSSLSVVSAGALVFLAERSEPATNIDTLGDGIWWAMTTITTVGYGDTSPITPAGRAVGFALMLIGIAVFSGVTATVASIFSRDDHGTTQTDLQDLRNEIAALRVALERTIPAIVTTPPGESADQPPTNP